MGDYPFLGETLMATQKDVAKLANVSFITVSRVINNMGNVKDETRVRVEKAIKELNYYPNSIAQGLNSNKVKTLSIQAPLPDNTSIEGTSYYRRILIGVEKYCITKGYDILISAQRGLDEQFDFLKPFYERKADGILIIASKPTTSQIDNIKKDNIPCALIGDRHNSISIHQIDTENFNGMYTAASYLITNGHKDIAYIKGNRENQNANDRFKGFKQAMKENHLIIKSEFIFDGDYTKESGKEALKYYRSLKSPPTAVLSSTDLMAIGFYEQSITMGINIPEDISIIGFDGHEICSFTTPPISTMYQPLELMGEEAAKLLIDQIEENNKSHKNVIFPIELNKGGSVKDLTRQS